MSSFQVFLILSIFANCPFSYGDESGSNFVVQDTILNENLLDTSATATSSFDDDSLLTWILSPMFGTGSYPNGSNKTWSLVGHNSNQCLAVRFTEFKLEASVNCEKDRVELYDGDSDKAPLIARLCLTADSEHGIFKASSNKIFIRFQSDSEGSASGFRAAVYSVDECPPKRETTTQTTSTTTTIFNMKRISEKIMEKHWNKQWKDKVKAMYLEVSVSSTLELPVGEQLQCGRQLVPNAFSQIDQRIVGGKVATPHAWPWQVSLRYLGRHICGGCIISDNWIVSAGHCFANVSTNPEDFQVWVGKHHKDLTDFDSKGVITDQHLRVKTISIHPDFYRRSRHDSDIAVVEIDGKFRFNNYVSPICLPVSDESEHVDDEPCVVTGFGETQGTGGANYLKETEVNLITSQQCAKMDSRLSVGFFTSLFSS